MSGSIKLEDLVNEVADLNERVKKLETPSDIDVEWAACRSALNLHDAKIRRKAQIDALDLIDGIYETHGAAKAITRMKEAIVRLRARGEL